MADHRNGSIFEGVDAMLDDLEQLYKDVHSHPELSMQGGAHVRQSRPNG